MGRKAVRPTTSCCLVPMAAPGSGWGRRPWRVRHLRGEIAGPASSRLRRSLPPSVRVVSPSLQRPDQVGGAADLANKSMNQHWKITSYLFLSICFQYALVIMLNNSAFFLTRFNYGCMTIPTPFVSSLFAIQVRWLDICIKARATKMSTNDASA